MHDLRHFGYTRAVDDSRGPSITVVLHDTLVGSVQVGTLSPPRLSRRFYLVMAAIEAGADVWTAVEAVSSTALEHEEWDMDEERTWAEWEQEYN